MNSHIVLRILLGVGASLAFAATHLPPNTPEWVALLISTVNAGMVVFLATTTQTIKKKDVE